MTYSNRTTEQYSEHRENRFSIIVPTYNREKDLKDLLFSISQQTRLPLEIVIVDDSENFRTRDLVEQFRQVFSEKEVVLKYLHNLTRSSLTAARNLGLTHATGEIILFVDDDVVLEKEYIEEILKVYQTHPNANGVQGYITNTPKHETLFLRLRNHLRGIFFLYSLEKSRCRVLPSAQNTYPYQLDKVIRCQWLHGCNQSYKYDAIKNSKFDENLKRYALMEDVEFSYRLFKKCPNTLYITPCARIFHKWSKTSRQSIEPLIYTETINRVYFFYKHIRQSSVNKLIFIWSCLGRMFFPFLLMVTYKLPSKKSPKGEIKYIRFLIKSYIYAIRHLEEIKIGNLTFFENIFKHFVTRQV